MKEQVLRFVESRGTARYSEIQRFIVDTKFGDGTYESGYRMEDHYAGTNPDGSWKYVQRRKNSYRGYYAAAFSISNGGYFLKGPHQLKKTTDGSYKVVRNAK